MSQTNLAILGGPRAVRVEPREHWPVPADRIKAAIGDLIDRGIYTEAGTGTTVALEERFARYVGVRHCLAQNNGTSTLSAAYYALGIGPGDEVLHPAYTWLCSIAPAVHLGAKPVFCEVDPATLTIDPADMERRITDRTRAVSIVHIHGNVCDMDAILSIAKRRGIAVVEDCSHAHGGEWDGRKLGSLGTIGCFSMQGGVPTGKPLPAGEGGLVVTDRRDLYERMLFYGHLNRAGLHQGFSDPALRQLAPTNSGIKFRPHAWGMALAMVMFDSLDERNAKRRAYRRKIYDALAEVPGVDPLRDHAKATPAGFYGGMHFVYRPEEVGGLALADFMAALRAEGVVVGVPEPYLPTHRLRLFAEGWDLYGHGSGPLVDDYEGYPAGSLPVTETLHAHLIAMPTFIEETPGYSDQLCEAFQKVSAHHATLQTKKARLRLAAGEATRGVTSTARKGLRRLLKR